MNGNLLLIDDEVNLLKNLKILLEDNADNVFIAENGTDALKILSTEDIHCVVCDINMPGMSGVEVLKTIRALKNNVPFIFYSGHGNKELMLEAARYGAFDFFNKPLLVGLETSVRRGLAKSLNKTEIIDSDYISEYVLMINSMEKNQKA